VNLTAHPFTAAVDARGELRPATSTVQRRLSHMRGMYRDAEAEAAAVRDEDPLIYEVYQYDVPKFAGELIPCTTVLHAGKVGDEFFMTKGHFHEQRDRAEIYYGLSGQGQLVMAKDGEAETVAMDAGTVAYVPPHWAHRTVNTGDVPFVFLAVYPGDAGHDYGTIETHGFPQVVLERNGQVVVLSRDEA
jgi:glucose-6-phosphate isomerase